MALMLRKACQPILDTADFDTFHADIGTNNFLQIFTPCGRPLMPVHGVRFASTRPSADEIEFATTLLADWLIKNKGTINSFLAALEARDLYALSDTDPRYYKFKVAYNTEYIRDSMGYQTSVKKDVCSITGSNRSIEYSLNSKGQISYLTFDAPQKAETNFKLPKSLHTAMMKFMQEENASLKYTQAVEVLLSELNTCKT